MIIIFYFFRQAAVSVLSRGGVGPSDKFDAMNKTIIMSTCNENGDLLLPDFPAKASPVQLIKMAFSNTHNPRYQSNIDSGEVWWTQTTLNDKEVFPIIFTSETKGFGEIEWKNMGLTDYNIDNNYFYVTFTGPGKVENLKHIIRGDYIKIPELGPNEFAMTYIAPLWGAGKNYAALLGETDKIVPVSNLRIHELDYDEENGPIKLKLKVTIIQILKSQLLMI